MARDDSAGGAPPEPVETTSPGTAPEAGGEQSGSDAPTPWKQREAKLMALEQELATSAAHIAAATHRFLTALREFDAIEGWADYGARSAVHWLSWRIGMSPTAAREKVRIARALGRLPKVDESLRKAELSYSKIRAITRVATPENQVEVLATARATTAYDLERVCRKFRAVAATEIEKQPRPLAEHRWVRFQPVDEFGFVRVTMQFPAEEAAYLRAVTDESARLVRQRAHATQRLFAREAAAREAIAREAAAPAAGGFEGNASAPAVSCAANAGHVPERAASCPASADVPCGGSVESGIDNHAAAVPASEEASGAVNDDAARVCVRGATREVLFPKEQRKNHGGWKELTPDQIEQLCTFTRADAVLAIFESFHERRALSSRRLPRFEVVVQVPRAALEGTSDEPALLPDGTPISAEAARRISCDSALVRAEIDAEGNPLDVGRRTRAIPSAIDRALRLRDPLCRFPGCTQEGALHVHHAKHWAQGGETKVSNLVRLCGWHHWFVHEGGGSMEIEGRRFLFFDRKGRRIEDPPPLIGGTDPNGGLLEWLREHGPGAGISLPLPLTYGEHMDYGIVLDAWAAATYGHAVTCGDLSGVVPRLPLPDGRAPPPRLSG